MQDEGLPHRPPDKLNVVYADEVTPETADRKDLEPTNEEIKETMAEKIRADAKERSAMTLAETVFALAPKSRQDNVYAILEEMAADDRYADIKAVTTASGAVFFFSLRHIAAEQAFQRSRVEEAKYMVAEKVRADSRERVALTPAGDLHTLSEETKADRLDAVLGEMQTDERYKDIRKVTSANGEVFFHSDRHMTGGYAALLRRAAAGNFCATIVETVRDDSRLYPRATNTRIFEQKVFGIPPTELEGAVAEILRREEYGDIRKLVHPTTGGVYLFSTRFLVEPHAIALMDWEEVGKDNSP